MHHILSMDLPLFFSKKTIYLNFQKLSLVFFHNYKRNLSKLPMTDFLCRSCQIKVPMTSVILYQKLSPGHSYQHGCTAFFLPHGSCHRCAGSGSTSKGFTAAPFPDPHPQMLCILYPDNFHIHPFRKYLLISNNGSFLF